MRSGCLALAAVAAGWAGANYTASVKVQMASPVMRQIMRNENLAPPILASTLARLDDISTSEAHERILWNALMIDIRLTGELRNSGTLQQIDAAMQTMRERAQNLLRRAPRHATAWFILGLVDVTQEGPQPEALARIAFSYELAPREAWIARRRNPAIVRLYPLLSPELRGLVVQEFRELVRLRFFAEAVETLRIAPQMPRDALIAGLEPLDDEIKRSMGRALDIANLDLDLPGVPRIGQRPWN